MSAAAKKKPKSNTPLTPKQQAFVSAYIRLNMNATAAYMESYGVKDYNVAAACASRLLKNAKISDLIQSYLKVSCVTAEEIMHRLSQHSRGNMDDFIGGFDRIDLAEARKRGLTHLIKKIKQRTTTISKSDGEDIETHDVEIELYDAQAATVHLARLLGMNPAPALRLDVTFDWRIKAKELGVVDEAESLADSLFDKAIARGGVVIEHEPGSDPD